MNPHKTSYIVIAICAVGALVCLWLLLSGCGGGAPVASSGYMYYHPMMCEMITEHKPYCLQSLLKPLRCETYNDVEHCTNGEGWRDVEHNPRGRPVVLVIGDSFVYGAGVEFEKIFTRRLSDAMPGVDVIAMGVCGASFADYYLILKHFGMKYKPDVIVISVVGNDFEEHSLRYPDWGEYEIFWSAGFVDGLLKQKWREIYSDLHTQNSFTGYSYNLSVSALKAIVGLTPGARRYALIWNKAGQPQGDCPYNGFEIVEVFEWDKEEYWLSKSDRHPGVLWHEFAATKLKGVLSAEKSQ